MDHARHEGKVDIDAIFTLQPGRRFDTGLCCGNLFQFFFSMHGFKCASQRDALGVRHLLLTATISISLLRPSFSKRAMRLRALLQRVSGSSSLRAFTIVQWGPSTKFITAFPSSANYSSHTPRGFDEFDMSQGGGKKKGERRIVRYLVADVPAFKE
jgi:hypothetical protein